MILYDGQIDIPKKGEVIFTLDIETTSLFRDPDTGEWEVFDYSKDPSYYEGCLKVGIPYIWMFGVNDTVYYGTEFLDIERVLTQISSAKKKRYLWIQNSGFEFEYMRDFLEKYTISKMIARAARKPIAYIIQELNIEVRCTLMLTNLSLEKAAERYTDVKKAVGDLDYNKARSPRTVKFMSDQELYYCYMDIITLYKIVLYFLNKYGALRYIPYTQTGEVRKAFRKTVDFGYVRWIAGKTPDDRVYLMLNKAFQGGLTHGNALYVNTVLHDILSFDIASSYPTTYLFKMPMGKFRKINPERADKLDRNKWAILYHVIFHNIRSKKLNHYILCSKVVTGDGILMDNGRLVSADSVEMYLTELDYDVITKDAYEIERVNIIEAYATIKGYMPKPFIDFALQLYKDKTELKGVAGQEDYYMKQKQMLNSTFGCCTTNVLKSGVEYINHEWKLPELSLEYIHGKLQQLRESKSNCFCYAWGVWITAYARATRLWKVISALDDLVVYYDTDSVKVPDNPRVWKVIKAENDRVRSIMEQTCEELEIDKALLSPVDPDGVHHPLGMWEHEDKNRAKEFKTLGAKRYCYRTYDNKLHCVVSGVNNKTGYKALHDDINNFSKSLVFDYDSAGKLISFYNDDQPVVIFKDYLGQVYKSYQKHGICLQPAQYSMSMQPTFEAYVEETQNGFKKGEWIK